MRFEEAKTADVREDQRPEIKTGQVWAKTLLQRADFDESFFLFTFAVCKSALKNVLHSVGFFASKHIGGTGSASRVCGGIAHDKATENKGKCVRRR